jgi:hypothetical protein
MCTFLDFIPREFSIAKDRGGFLSRAIDEVIEYEKKNNDTAQNQHHHSPQ